MITSREVDIYVNRYGIQACIPAVQYDSGRRIVFRVVDAVIPSGTTSYIFIRKPSGNAEYILSTISGNTITVDMTNQSLSEYGINKAQIRIIKDEEVITSFDVVFDVKRSYADNAVESESGDMPAKLIDDIAMINARVDAFEALEDGSTTGDAELQDGRIGYNGTTYGSIGTAIRSQISDLHAAIDNDISAEDVDYDGFSSGLSATNVQDAIDEVVDSIGSQTGDTVPAEVKNAIYILLSKAAYIETGLSDELAIVEAWTATTLTVTNRLTRCTTSNTAATVESRSRYSATLTANSGYILNNVKVTMGGVDITSTAYSSGTITIPSVTGNIVITAVAVQAVSSLSAVYTQSGTVYDTDSLDTLKNNLVVTAHYSDSSTAVIPSTDYELSGTLEIGTSTITVSYAGKTSTFNVTVTMSRETRFGTFVNGHGVSKSTGGAVPSGGIYISSTSARAAFSTPIANNGYTLTVTDSSKYNIAIYDVQDNTPISTTHSQAIEHVYYTGGSKSISWKTSDSATTPYILVALKKMDNTAFTNAELANGAEAVFTFTSTE